MRLIDAEAFAKRMERAYCSDCESYKSVRCEDCDIGEILDELGYEPTIEAKQVEWISVKDRLPELIPCKAGTAYSETVLVWTSGGKMMCAIWDGIEFLFARGFWEAWREEVTHWMPLPKPPKGE